MKINNTGYPTKAPVVNRNLKQVYREQKMRAIDAVIKSAENAITAQSHIPFSSIAIASQAVYAINNIVNSKPPIADRASND